MATAFKFGASGAALIVGAGLAMGTVASASLTATISINDRRDNLAAPDRLEFEVDIPGFTSQPPVSGKIDDRFNDWEVVWDHGASEEFAFTHPTKLYQGSARHTNGHRNNRYSYGHKTHHVCVTPGSKTVNVWAVELSTGKTASGSLAYTVKDPLDGVTYAAADIIYLSPGGDFTGNGETVPSGVTEVTSGDLTAAFNTYIKNQDETVPKLILLNAGESYTLPNGIGFGTQYSSGTPSVHFKALGAGTATITSSSGNFYTDPGTALGGGQKWVVWEKLTMSLTGALRFEDTSLSQINDPGSNNAFWAQMNEKPPTVCMISCSCEGYNYYVETVASSPLATDSDGAAVFFNSYTTNRNCVMLWRRWSRVTSIGCRHSVSPNAYADATAQANGQGFAFRLGTERTGGGFGYFQSNDFFTRQGWSPTGSIEAVQGAFRLNFRGADDNEFIIVGNTMESSFNMIGMEASDGDLMPTTNTLIAMNYFLGGYQNGTHIIGQFPGVVVKANVFVQPVVQSRGGSARMDYLVAFSSHNTPDTNDPIWVYSNSFIFLMDETIMQNSLDGTVSNGLHPGATAYANFTDENNLDHLPGKVGGFVGHVPLDLSSNMFTPEELGYLSSTTDLRSTTFTPTTAGQVPLPRPQTGSSAIEGANVAQWVSALEYSGALREDLYVAAGLTGPALGALEK